MWWKKRHFFSDYLDFPVSIIAPMLYTHSSIYHQRCVIWPLATSLRHLQTQGCFCQMVSTVGVHSPYSALKTKSVSVVITLSELRPATVPCGYTVHNYCTTHSQVLFNVPILSPQLHSSDSLSLHQAIPSLSVDKHVAIMQNCRTNANKKDDDYTLPVAELRPQNMRPINLFIDTARARSYNTANCPSLHFVTDEKTTK